jgi:hypothetical protein
VVSEGFTSEIMAWKEVSICIQASNLCHYECTSRLLLQLILILRKSPFFVNEFNSHVNFTFTVNNFHRMPRTAFL